MEFESKNRLSINDYLTGIRNGDNVILSRAITVLESKLESDQHLAKKIIENILPDTGNSIRIGITGVPGVGKSTFIESFGELLTSIGKKVAVLAIDPSSKKSKGSILGDKTRMPILANNPNAFIRPSASGDFAGGIGSKSWETLLVCETAGYDVIIVETVGVGQSETMVREIVDFFLLLALAGAGDELQGFKRGIMELADAIAITKADGENIKNAMLAKSEFSSALHLFPPSTSGWEPKVSICSAIDNRGIKEIWEEILEFINVTKESGYFENNRVQQQIDWLHAVIQRYLQHRFLNNPKLDIDLKKLENKIRGGELSPLRAAEQLIRKIEDNE